MTISVKRVYQIFGIPDEWFADQLDQSEEIEMAHEMYLPQAITAVKPESQSEEMRDLSKSCAGFSTWGQFLAAFAAAFNGKKSMASLHGFSDN